MRIKFVFLFGLFLISFLTFSQETSSNPNPNSAYPIDEADMLYKAQVWRRMDLNEKVNRPFFSENNQISKFLIEGVKSGALKPYSNDSLKTILTLDAFIEKLKVKIDNNSALTEEEKKAGFGGEDGNSSTPGADGADDGWGSTKKTDEFKAEKTDDGFGSGSGVIESEYYFPKQLSILEIKEDAIIDRKRSRLYFDVQALTLKIPAAQGGSGIEESVASFSFKEVHKYFKDRKDCIWFNPTNEMQHRNMADALDLRLFNAYIIKKGNGANQFIADEKGMDANKTLRKSQKLEQQLQDKEAEMWEN